MRSFRRDEPLAGEIITPHEFMAECADVATALHLVSQENFAANLITEDKLKNTAWRRFYHESSTTTRQVTHQAGTQPGPVFWIPDDTGNDWVVNFLCGDATLHVSLGAWWEDNGGADHIPLWIGIRVNGIIEAQSPISAIRSYIAGDTVLAEVPVKAGTQRVEAVYGLTKEALSASLPLDWQDRHLAILEKAR